MTDTSIKEILSRYRVKIGLLVALAVILLARPTWLSILASVGLSSIALLIRGWAAGHLRKEKALAISGPYHYSRNPLYLGNLILGIAIVAGARSWWVLGLFMAYFLVFYPAIIRREKERMRGLFPEEYEEYRKHVPAFFPTFKKYPADSPASFSFALYLKNKEFRAAIGTIALWILFAAKILLLNR